MIQEKPTSLRILQSHKKKNIPPAIYLFIGFLSGIIFSLLFFLIFFKEQYADDILKARYTEQDTELTNHSKPDLPSSNIPTITPHETNEVAEDNNFTQPESNELNKFFQHATHPTAHPEQRVSPFANEPNAPQTAQTTIKKLPQQKHEPVPPIERFEKKSIPAQKTKPTEPEVEAPQATVQIKVTQKPFSVNELQ